jgi:hypothetical protein
MADTTATVQTGKLGPGVLKIGATGSAIEISCLVNNVAITNDKDQSDATTKLCGDVRPGSTTYKAKMAGNVDTDVADEAGLFALSQSAKGTQQAFEFTPDNVLGTTASGVLVIDPLDFGADNMGDPLASDFEWAIVGEVTYAYGVAGP